MIRAGYLTERVTIERATSSRDAMNAKVETWAPLGTRWCQVNYGRGDERREAARESATLPASFRFRADGVTTSLTVKDRLTFEGAAWDITSVVPFERVGVDVTATRSAD